MATTQIPSTTFTNTTFTNTTTSQPDSNATITFYSRADIRDITTAYSCVLNVQAKQITFCIKSKNVQVQNNQTCFNPLNYPPRVDFQYVPFIPYSFKLTNAQLSNSGITLYYNKGLDCNNYEPYTVNASTNDNDVFNSFYNFSNDTKYNNIVSNYQYYFIINFTSPTGVFINDNDSSASSTLPSINIPAGNNGADLNIDPAWVNNPDVLPVSSTTLTPTTTSTPIKDPYNTGLILAISIIGSGVLFLFIYLLIRFA